MTNLDRVVQQLRKERDQAASIFHMCFRCGPIWQRP